MTDHLAKAKRAFNAEQVVPKAQLLLTALKQGNLRRAATHLNNWGVGGVFFYAREDDNGEYLDIHDTDPESDRLLGRVVYDTKGQFVQAEEYLQTHGRDTYIHLPRTDISFQQMLPDLVTALFAIRAPRPADREIQSAFSSLGGKISRIDGQPPRRPA